MARTRAAAARQRTPKRRRKRKLSKSGARFIAAFEGFRSDLYDDPAGHCTIGCGHLVHHGRCDGSEPAEFRKGITRERALELLLEDAEHAADAVNRGVQVPLNQHQFDALVSFVFNVGAGAFGESTLLRKLNEGRYDAVPKELDRWVKADGRTLPGLVRRRKSEGELFTEGGLPLPDGKEMTTREVQTALKKLGWPIRVDGAWGRETFAAVKDFQRGFAYWRLLVDGNAGVKTQDALRKAVGQRCSCSPNFNFSEFRSKGDGWIKVSRELVLGLEEYRELVGGPVSVISGYRDPQRNASIPGASRNSQHLYGNAADIAPAKSVTEVKRLRCFSGIGYQSASGLVRHVDVRHVGPNTTGNSIADPAIWVY